MAYLKQAKNEDEIKSLTVANVKKAYNELSSDYNKLINLDYVYCPCCGEFKSATGFYSSKKTKSPIKTWSFVKISRRYRKRAYGLNRKPLKFWWS